MLLLLMMLMMSFLAKIDDVLVSVVVSKSSDRLTGDQQEGNRVNG